MKHLFASLLCFACTVGQYANAQPMSGDYLIIGLEAFSRAAGRNIAAETRTRTVARQSPAATLIQPETELLMPRMQGMKPLLELANHDGKNIEGQFSAETIEEQYTVLTENGKPYDGPKTVATRRGGGANSTLLISYPTLTAAVSDLNLNGVSGPVRFLITSTYPGSAAETFPITINSFTGASATNVVTIKPDAGASPVITCNTATALLILNGCAYVTIDGSNLVGGTTKDLTISDTYN